MKNKSSTHPAFSLREAIAAAGIREYGPLLAAFTKELDAAVLDGTVDFPDDYSLGGHLLEARVSLIFREIGLCGRGWSTEP